MRDGFREIASGWTLVVDFDAITDRIEALSRWTAGNGPLEPDEQATVQLMIECQIAWAMDEGINPLTSPPPRTTSSSPPPPNAGPRSG